jgi:hypothetical protein
MDDSDVTLIERYRYDFDGNSASSSIFELCAIDASLLGLPKWILEWLVEEEM